MRIYLKKGTHKIRFNNMPPRRVVMSFDGGTWLDRDLDGSTKEISVNTMFDGYYESPNNFTVVASGPLEVKEPSIKLYKNEREFERPIQIVYNPDLQGTPARIFTQMNPARIEIGDKFKTFAPQVRMFILLHEYGHLFYKDEHKTDLFALKEYLKLGLNASQAFYALSKVLHDSEANTERIKKLFHELKINGYVQTKD